MKRVIVVALVVFLLDQAGKLIVVEWMDLRSRGVIGVLEPWVTFRMAWNRGVNFGLLASSDQLFRWILVVVSVVISIWVAFWVRQMRGVPPALFGGFLIGGALGNAMDRVRYGAVADYLNVTCCGLNNPYAFNVADISIFVGAFGLVLFGGKPRNGW